MCDGRPKERSDHKQSSEEHIDPPPYFRVGLRGGKSEPNQSIGLDEIEREGKCEKEKQYPDDI